MSTVTTEGRASRGAALLIVLWLSAALSAIALSLAASVRGEVERTTTALDGTRAYYLAAGAIERALLYIQWSQIYRRPDGFSPFYWPGAPVLEMPFPSGVARVEVIPESSKMNLNTAPPDELYRLLLNLGVEPERAHVITMAIADWRAVVPPPTVFDQYYMSLQPSFRARHASFEEVEELLYVRGMTPELFHGSYERDAQGRLVGRPGLRDCVSVYGAAAQYDVNTVEPAVLAAVGVPPPVIATIVETRQRTPFQNYAQVMAVAQAAGPAGNRLRLGGGAMFTLRATARLLTAGGVLSDQRRSVEALVSIKSQGPLEPYTILRWYDNVWLR